MARLVATWLLFRYQECFISETFRHYIEQREAGMSPAWMDGSAS